MGDLAAIGFLALLLVLFVLYLRRKKEVDRRTERHAWLGGAILGALNILLSGGHFWLCLGDWLRDTGEYPLAIFVTGRVLNLGMAAGGVWLIVSSFRQMRTRAGRDNTD